MNVLVRRYWIAILGVVIAAIVAVAGTLSQNANHVFAQSSGANNAVTIQGFQFKPNTLTVKRGSQVSFTNKDAAPHTVTPENGATFAGSGRLQKNDSRQVAFNQVGEQDYFCEIHPSMKGKIVVTK